MSVADARRLDADAHALGLANRSEAVREGLRLLHRRARHAALADDYDAFSGAGAKVPVSKVPVSEIAAIGEQIAAAVIADDQPAE